MPWEEDEELKELEPVEILQYMGKELNLKEKAKLNEMVIEQLMKERREKSDKIIEMMSEARKKNKEIERLKMKLLAYNNVDKESEEVPASTSSSSQRIMTRSK
jgi:hypothetical protein